MSKLYKFEIIKPEIEHMVKDDVCTMFIDDIASSGELIELYIHCRKIEGKAISATITIEVEAEDDKS